MFKNLSLDIVQYISVGHNVRVNSSVFVCILGRHEGYLYSSWNLRAAPLSIFFLAFLHLTEVNENFLHAFSRP